MLESLGNADTFSGFPGRFYLLGEFSQFGEFNSIEIEGVVYNRLSDLVVLVDELPRCFNIFLIANYRFDELGVFCQLGFKSVGV